MPSGNRALARLIFLASVCQVSPPSSANTGCRPRGLGGSPWQPQLACLRVLRGVVARLWGTDRHSTNTSPAGAFLQLVPPVKLLRQEKQRAPEVAGSGRGRERL